MAKRAVAKKVEKVTYLFGVLIFTSVLLNIFFVFRLLDKNRAVKIIDGDSLNLKDGTRIRLLGVDAPEQGRCMSYRAQTRLKQLTLNKRVTLRDMVKDSYGRLLANVFVGNIFVNKVLAEEGLARFEYVKSPYYDELKEAQNQARSDKIGIFSSLCRMTSIGSVDCNIKGNTRAGEKIYHLPSCPNYSDVIIDESYGDHWFCSETEAINQGFRKAKGCN